MTLYKNARCTYAERVHACIATLAFGNYAQLFSQTHRGKLFDKVLNKGMESLLAEPVKIDQEKLDNEKEKFVKNFQTLYKSLVEVKENNEICLLQVYIETISACNRNCAYCYYAEANNEVRIMSDEIFDLIIENLKEINYSNILYLFDINEPLLDKRMPELIRKVATNLPNAHIYIFSNGDLATEDLVKEYFSNGLTHMVFSLHDHVNDEKIEKIIESVGAEYFTIADMTVLKTEEFVNRGGSISDAKIASQVLFPNSSCILPFRQILINPEGDYRLCCAIRDEVLLGNIKHMCIENHFNSCKELNGYRDVLCKTGRKNLIPCNKCSFEGEKSNMEGIIAKLGKNYRYRSAIYRANPLGII